MTVGAVTLDKRPEKIVVALADATEMLFAIGAGKQVVAVDDQSNYPANAPKTDLSGFKPNAEAIAKNPDLVVLSNDPDKIVDAARPAEDPDLPDAGGNDARRLVPADRPTSARSPARRRGADLAERMKDDIAKLVKDLPQRAEKLTYYHELDPTVHGDQQDFIGSLFARSA